MVSGSESGSSSIPGKLKGTQHAAQFRFISTACEPSFIVIQDKCLFYLAKDATIFFNDLVLHDTDVRR